MECESELNSPVLSWYSRCYSLGWPLTAAQSSCWSCLCAGAQLLEHLKFGFTLSFTPAQILLVKYSYILNLSHWTWALTFIVLGSPFIISGTPRSFLLSRKKDRNKDIKLAWLAGCRKFSTLSCALMQQCCISVKLGCNYAMYGWVRGAIVLWFEPVKTSWGDIIT